MTLDERTFETLADQTLARLMEDLEAAVGEQLEVDLENGILTIELDNGGRYVINKHAPNRQIWMSSPASGASHFDCGGEHGWVSTRGGDTLAAMLSTELSTALGAPVDLG
ncbi:MAG: iron donor protein CyaY [Rhodospirillales bacterium]